jgi:hypothetical protein
MNQSGATLPLMCRKSSLYARPICIGEFQKPFQRTMYYSEFSRHVSAQNVKAVVVLYGCRLTSRVSCDTPVCCPGELLARSKQCDRSHSGHRYHNHHNTLNSSHSPVYQRHDCAQVILHHCGGSTAHALLSGGGVGGRKHCAMHSHLRALNDTPLAH